jgi:hypothetical protein
MLIKDLAQWILHTQLRQTVLKIIYKGCVIIFFLVLLGFVREIKPIHFTLKMKLVIFDIVLMDTISSYNTIHTYEPMSVVQFMLIYFLLIIIFLFGMMTIQVSAYNRFRY